MLLLDTHPIVWLDEGRPMSAAARAAIRRAARSGGILVSPVSAWEIGNLVRKGRLALKVPVVDWFERFLGLPGVQLVALTVAAAAESSFLPGDFHADPADRMLVATARELGVPLVTRDSRILDYAATTRAISVIAC